MSLQDEGNNSTPQIPFVYFLWSVMISLERWWSGCPVKFGLEFSFLSVGLVATQGSSAQCTLLFNSLLKDGVTNICVKVNAIDLVEI